MSKRIALITASAIAFVGGGAAAIGGGAVLAVFGTDNTISSGHHPVSTTTSALVTEQGDFGTHSADVLGHPAVKISVTGAAKPVFIGSGRRVRRSAISQAQRSRPLLTSNCDPST